MGFLIRSAFWLSLVLLVVPFEAGSEHADTIGPLQALHAAREAMSDVSGICERKPEVCETGRAAFQTIGLRAREGVKTAYEMLDDTSGEPDAALAGETKTASIAH
jgi:hypothetical protein